MGAQNLRFAFSTNRHQLDEPSLFLCNGEGKKVRIGKGLEYNCSVVWTRHANQFAAGSSTVRRLLVRSRRVVTPIISSRKSNSDGSSSRSEGNPWCVYRCIRKHIVVSMLGSLNIDPATELLLRNEIWHSPVYQRCRMTVDAESAADAAA